MLPCCDAFRQLERGCRAGVLQQWITENYHSLSRLPETARDAQIDMPTREDRDLRQMPSWGAVHSTGVFGSWRSGSVNAQ